MPPWFTKVCQMIWAQYPLERKNDAVSTYCAVARDARNQGNKFYVPSIIVDVENNLFGELGIIEKKRTKDKNRKDVYLYSYNEEIIKLVKYLIRHKLQKESLI